MYVESSSLTQTSIYQAPMLGAVVCMDKIDKALAVAELLFLLREMDNKQIINKQIGNISGTNNCCVVTQSRLKAQEIYQEVMAAL